MECKTAEQLMSDYITDQIDESVKPEFEKHLSECESCKKLFDELKNEGKNFEEQPKEKPFKKVNKVIKSQKRKKIIFICLAAVLAALLIIVTIGELNPESGLPSITRYRYKQKAKEIVQEFFDGNVEILIKGEGMKTAGADLTNAKSRIGSAMIKDYISEIQKLYDSCLYGNNFKIEKISLKYAKQSPTYFEYIHPADNNYVKNYYTATIFVTGNEMDYQIEIAFDNFDEYFISFYEISVQSPIETNSNYDYIYRINKYIEQINLYIRDLDWKKYILNNLLTASEDFVGISNNMFSIDCSRDSDETYITELNKRLEKIKTISYTESADFVVRGYNSPKHALDVQLIWKIEDLNGKKAVMTKDFLQGPWAYQKLDENEQFVEEEGFSPELKQMLEELF